MKKGGILLSKQEEQRFGVVNADNGWSFPGYTLKELDELIENLSNDAEIFGSDLQSQTGDAAIGPKLLKDLVETIRVDHEQAGIVINQEMVRMQAIGLGHGLLAALNTAKIHLGENSEAFKSIQCVTLIHVQQAIAALLGLGMTAEEANARILKGH